MNEIVVKNDKVTLEGNSIAKIDIAGVTLESLEIMHLEWCKIRIMTGFELSAVPRLR
jgi:hypothetical protein